jgi:hypothetical protein
MVAPPLKRYYTARWLPSPADYRLGGYMQVQSSLRILGSCSEHELNPVWRPQWRETARECLYNERCGGMLLTWMFARSGLETGFAHRHTGRVQPQSPDTRVLTSMIFVDLRRWCMLPFNRKEFSWSHLAWILIPALTPLLHWI